MNPNNYTPEIRELIAKNILLANGGSVYPHSEELAFDVTDKDGNTVRKKVTSIHFSPGFPCGGCYLHFIGGDAILKDEEDRQKVWNYVVLNWTFPDKHILYEKEPLEERLRLRERNICFISRHGDLEEEDFQMIAGYQKFFAESRKALKDNPVPLPGDIVEGTYYTGRCTFDHGVIETAPHYSKELSVCAQPYVPFVHFRSNEHKEIGLSVSGGPFFGLDKSDLEYVGADERYLCDWGHSGACECGSIDFPVKVNRWKIKGNIL